MSPFSFAILLFCFAPLSWVSFAGAMSPKAGALEILYTPIPDSYIVTLKNDHERTKSNLHILSIIDLFTFAKIRHIARIFKEKSFNGYAVTCSEAVKNEIERMEEVLSVEQDYYIQLPGGQPFDEAAFFAEMDNHDNEHIHNFINDITPVADVESPDSEFFEFAGRNTTTQKNAPWGLARISSKVPVPEEKSTSPFTYPTESGKNATIYVVDTGVQIKHTEFGGRARASPSFTRDGNEDVFGHGSHVAGIAAGATFGVAKRAKVVGVKVLGNRGSGTISGVIKGLEWVLNDAKALFGKSPVIVNMSLGGPKSTALETACKAISDAGGVVAVAAGNSRADACRYSPSGGKGVVSVAASCGKDNFASFSNHGNCTHIIAPGCNIPSIDVKGKKEIAFSGTSMASPHIAGIAALIGEYYKISCGRKIEKKLFRLGQKNAITAVPILTPNLLGNILGMLNKRSEFSEEESVQEVEYASPY